MGRAGEQELPWSGVVVDDPFDLRDEVGCALHLVDDHHVGIVLEEGLEVVIDGLAHGDIVECPIEIVAGKRPCKRGFADLSRPFQEEHSS